MCAVGVNVLRLVLYELLELSVSEVCEDFFDVGGLG